MMFDHIWVIIILVVKKNECVFEYFAYCLESDLSIENNSFKINFLSAIEIFILYVEARKLQIA